MDKAEGKEPLKRYGNLFEKITSFDNLFMASKKALRGKREKQALFYFGLEKEVIHLKNDFSSNGYQPSDYRQFEIHEPKCDLLARIPMLGALALFEVVRQRDIRE